MDLQKLGFKDAVKEYQKLKYVSSYGAFYGRKPALEDLTDTSILKAYQQKAGSSNGAPSATVYNGQKFSQVPWTSILNTKTKEYLDKWQQIESEDAYKGMVLSTLRSLFTYVKIREPNTSTSRVSFKRINKKDLVKVERYDKLIEDVSQNVRRKFKMLPDSTFINKRKIIVPSQVTVKHPKRTSESYGRIASRTISIKNMKGNGNITSQNAPRDHTYNSFYKEWYQGKYSPNKLENYGNYYMISSGGGACIPDPKLMTLSQNRINGFSSSLQRTQNQLSQTLDKFHKMPNVNSGSSQKKIKRSVSIDV